MSSSLKSVLAIIKPSCCNMNLVNWDLNKPSNLNPNGYLAREIQYSTIAFKQFLIIMYLLCKHWKITLSCLHLKNMPWWFKGTYIWIIFDAALNEGESWDNPNVFFPIDSLTCEIWLPLLYKWSVKPPSISVIALLADHIFPRQNGKEIVRNIKSYLHNNLFLHFSLSS